MKLRTVKKFKRRKVPKPKKRLSRFKGKKIRYLSKQNNSPYQVRKPKPV